MKSIRKIIAAVLLLTVVLTLSEIPVISKPAAAQAAALKLSANALMLKVGESEALNVDGTVKAVKWSSSDKSVATVTGKGKVKAISAGHTVITAAVGKKKLTCRVTVTESDNPYLATAPFEAIEQSCGKINFVIPKDFIVTPGKDDNNCTISPKDNNKDFSFIDVSLDNDNTFSYDTLKVMLSSLLTKDTLGQILSDELQDTTFKIQDISQTELDTNNGKAIKVAISFDVSDVNFKMYMYFFLVDSSVCSVTVLDMGSLQLDKIAEYMINSVCVN
jgi:Bacterial surface proteins containing Ig-like domains